MFKGIFKIILISWVVTFNVSAQDSLYNQLITIDIKKVTADSILHYIEKEIDLNFTFDAGLVDTIEELNYEFVNLPLKNVLDRILINRNVEYKLIGNQIVLFKQNIEQEPKDTIKKKIPRFKNIKGRIYDEESYATLPYASIGVYNKSVGTVSNQEGGFLIKIHEDYWNDTLAFNYLGYYEKHIQISELDTFVEIGLKTKAVSLQEVIIRSAEPRTLVKKAIQKIENNYPDYPVMIRSFYRESILRDDKYMMYTEGLLDVYKSSYSRTIYTDQARLIKKRKYTDISKHDTVMFQLKGGIHSSLALDVIKNEIDFLNPELVENYRYQLSDIVIVNGKLTYLIDFFEIKDISGFQYNGTIYIDISSLAVVKVDFEITNSSLRKARNAFIIKSGFGVNVRPKKIKYSIVYKEVGGKYFVNHVAGELRMKVKKRRRFIRSVYTARFEMISTDIDSVNIKRFSASDRVKSNEIFSYWKSGYKGDFWENVNFILPENDLSKALERFEEGELEITEYN